MAYELLIVEDDESLRMIYEAMLMLPDLHMVSVSDGERAILHLQNHVPDVVVLDMLLPRISGEAVLSYIYNSPHLAATRVFIVSAHEGYRTTPLRPGDHFFLKPIVNGRLRHAIQEVLTALAKPV